MHKTTLYLDDELKQRVKVLALRQGRSEATVLREAISTYLAMQEKPKPRAIGIVKGGQVDAAEIEQWLDENWKPDW